MTDIALQISIGLLALGFLITIHELGHFAVAKWTGVKVNTFSIGFGPKLIKYKWGETTYCISAIPFGGYVAMEGEAPKEDSGRSYSEGEFQTKPIWVRAAIAFAGPAVNILFCLFLLWGIYLVGYPRQGLDQAVVGMIEKGSAAERAGFQLGDTVTQVNGKAVKGWQNLAEEVSMALGESLTVEVHGVNGVRLLNLVPTELKMKGQELGVGESGLFPAMTLIASENPPTGSPAALAGVKAGDTLLEFGGQKILGNLFEMVQKNGAQATTLLVARPEGRSLLEIQPQVRDSQYCPTGKSCYMMNLPLRFPERYESYGPVEAFKNAAQDSYEYALMPFKFIAKIITGGIKLKAMSGPVGIVQVVGKTFTFGFVNFLLLVALISMNLGIMNLLPLAITDGGILLFLLYEAIRGKPLRAEWQQKIQQVAVAFFITLFIYVLIQDLLRVHLFY